MPCSQMGATDRAHDDSFAEPPRGRSHEAQAEAARVRVRHSTVPFFFSFSLFFFERPAPPNAAIGEVVRSAGFSGRVTTRAGASRACGSPAKEPRFWGLSDHAPEEGRGDLDHDRRPFDRAEGIVKQTAQARLALGRRLAPRGTFVGQSIRAQNGAFEERGLLSRFERRDQGTA